MAGLDEKDIGDMVCAQCLGPITKDEIWLACLHYVEAKLIYAKVHSECLEQHKLENGELE